MTSHEANVREIHSEISAGAVQRYNALTEHTKTPNPLLTLAGSCFILLGKKEFKINSICGHYVPRH